MVSQEVVDGDYVVDVWLLRRGRPVTDATAAREWGTLP